MKPDAASPAPRIPESTGRVVGLVVVGWLVSRLVLGWCPPIQAGGLFLNPASLAPLLVALLSIPLVFGRPSRNTAFWLCVGWLCDVGPWLAFRPGTGAVTFGFWDRPSLVGSLVCLVATLALLEIASLKPNRERRTPPLLPLSLVPAGLVAVASIVAVRVPYYTMAHIPNEERSVFVGGVEVHHLCWGLAGLILIAVWTRTDLGGTSGRLLALLAYGLSLGFYLDEAAYYLLAEVSDAAYGGLFSMIGGGLLLVATFAGTRAWLARVYAAPDRPPVRPPGLPSGARRIIGHRGAAGLEDENTLEAIQVATDLGLEMVEVDVGITRDGAMFLFHDTWLGRTTGVAGRFGRMSADGIRALRTKAGYSIPSLDDVLEATADSEILLFLDMKRAGRRLEPLAEAIERAGAAHRVILDFEHLHGGIGFKRRHPELCVVLSPFLPWLQVETIIAADADGIDAWWRFLKPSTLARLARHGLVRTCWYTSDGALGRRILERDLDGLMSDHPDRLLEPAVAPESEPA